MGPGGARRRPQTRRDELNRRREKQMAQVKKGEADRNRAEALLEEWKETAWERLQDVCNVAYPAETPDNPTSAGVVLGRLQGFLWPMRTAMDMVELHDQIKRNLDKTRDQLDGMEEDDFEEV